MPLSLTTPRAWSAGRSPGSTEGDLVMHDINRRAVLAGTALAAGAALGASAFPPTAALARPAAGGFAAIDAALGAAVSNGTVLGVTAMGATPDRVVYDGAFGKANIETGAPMRDDT